MKRILTSIVCSTILFTSACSLLYEFREIEELQDWQWDGDKAFRFTYEASETKQLNGTMIFRHVYGFRHDDVKIACEITSPSRVLDTTFVVPFRNEEGEYLGQGSVDLWDLEFNFLRGYTFEPGKHTITFRQETADPLQLMMEVGVKLEVPKD